MAVGAARSIATRLQKIRRLSSLYHDEVTEFRADAVKATADNLWRRYTQDCRRRRRLEEPVLSYLDWLVSMAHMERTFWHKNGGMSLSVRRRWAIDYYNFLTRKELTFADDPENVWVIDALKRALNDRNDNPDWMIDVETVTLRAIGKHVKKDGVSFIFVKVYRPASERNLE